MPLSAGQQAIADSTKRFRVAVCGRRFGKTYLAVRELARFATTPRQKCYYVAPSYRMAKQIVWEPLKYRLQDLRWVERINETELTIRLVNGSQISLRGADNPDSLRGVGLNFIVMDEFAWTQESAWSTVLRPTLSDTNGHAMFITTPVGKNNWAFDLFNRSSLDPENWQSWQYTSLEGGRITAEEIAQAQADLDERSFRQEYLASFEEYAGRIYYSFSNENIRKFERPAAGWDRQNILVFCDFNINPISAAVAVETAGGIHIIDEIVIYSSNTDELAQEVRNRYPTQPVTAFPDPAGAQRKTSAGGRTDISILENARFQVKYHRSHPPVRDRINAVNSAFRSSNNQVRLWIDPKCKRTIESFEKHAYKEGTQIPDKDTGWDHMTDAVGYGIEYLMPVRREMTQVEPRRWTHQTR